MLGRQFEVIDYFDDKTRLYFESSESELTFGLVKPDAYMHIGEILELAQAAALHVKSVKMLKLPRATAEEFYEKHRSEPFFKDLIDFMVSDVVLAFELSGLDAINRWKHLIETKVRSRFGRDAIRNAAHGSDSRESFIREFGMIFGEGVKFTRTALFNNCTLCLVKPHAVRNNLGSIVKSILAEGFEISAMETFQIPLKTAEEFLQVYRGTSIKVSESARELSKGVLVAMELREMNAVEKLRSLAGPPDPAMARHVAPQSLRAQYGEDLSRNAVHCTDLEEDGVIECEYFFKLLKS